MLEQYRDYLMSKGVSRHTAKGYVGDVSSFARWFEDTIGEIFAPESVTTIDVRGHISHLTNVRHKSLLLLPESAGAEELLRLAGWHSRGEG